tara:strand:- start:377 stop:784 length:408 start_codon:yes stop_codon:yes gene_type:complete
MEKIHETDSMLASFQTKSSILICEAKECEEIEIDSLLTVLRIWFENCKTYNRKFSIILDLSRSQVDLVAPCLAVANFFTGLDEKYVEFLTRVAISGCSWYYIELMNAVYTSDVPFKAVDNIEDGVAWISQDTDKE